MDIDQKSGECTANVEAMSISQSVFPECTVSSRGSDQHDGSLVDTSVGLLEDVGNSSRETAVDGSDPKPPKKRHRRAKRRRWKPYYKLSAEERRALELREEMRAERSRASRFAKGIPVAPYNTTQFLLNDRQQRDDKPLEDVDVIVDTIRHRAGSDAAAEGLSDSLTTTDSATTSGDDLYQMEEEFQHEYESAHAERLESMTRAQLVTECVRLEKELDDTYALVATLRKEIVELKKQRSSEQECSAAQVEHKEIDPSASPERHPP